MAILSLIMLVSSISFGAAIPALINKESNIAKESGHLLFISSIANVFGYLIMVLFIHSTFNYGQIIVIIIFLLSLSLISHQWKEKSNFAIVGVTSLASILFLNFIWNENLLYIAYKSFSKPNLVKRKLAGYKWGSQYRKYEDVFSINKIGDTEYFFINGFVSIALNSPEEYIVGAVSSMVSPRINEALVFGLGSGSTAGTVAQIFKKTDVVEINPIIVEHQSDMKQYNFDIENNKNVNIIADDGIRYLKNTNKEYDLILNTVTTPLYFSASKLYTVDFFKKVKKKLKKDGIYTTWIDSRIGEKGLKIILNSLKSEFKYSWTSLIKSSYFLLVCSNEDISLHQQKVIESNPVLKKFFMYQHGRNLDTIKYSFVSNNTYGLLEKNFDKKDFNTLDKPTLEFAIASLKNNADIKSFRKYIKDDFDLNKLNNKVFSNKNLNFLEYFKYHYQSANDSTLTNYLEDIATKENKDFRSKFEENLIKDFKKASIEYSGIKTTEKLISYLNRFDITNDIEKLSTNLINKYPNSYNGYYQLGKYYYNKNNYKKAEKLFKKALDLDKENSDVLYWLAKSYYEQYRFALAEDTFLEVLRLNPTEEICWYWIGRIYLIKEEYKNAINSFNKAIEIMEDEEGDYFYWLAKAYFENKQYEQAEENVKKAIKTAPDESDQSLELLKDIIISKK